MFVVMIVPKHYDTKAVLPRTWLILSAFTCDNLAQERMYLVTVTGRVISAQTYKKLIKSFRFKAIEK